MGNLKGSNSVNELLSNFFSSLTTEFSAQIANSINELFENLTITR
jgi:Mg2+ and Co2+ transporter CorA